MVVTVVLLLPLQVMAAKKKPVKGDREYWCEQAYRMAQPVLENMAKGELQKNMLLEVSPNWDGRNKKVAYMECFGRLMAGIAPWLSLPDDDTDEGRQRKQLREWALASYKNAVDPQSPDYLAWGIGGQNLVDAAYVAESFLRAFDTLWTPLDEETRQRYVTEFIKMRKIDPPYTNWLLFSSTIEAFLAKVNAPYDEYRVNSACRKVEEWYVGDGWYQDGTSFAFDYYSSYVFHPMYLRHCRRWSMPRSTVVLITRSIGTGNSSGRRSSPSSWSVSSLQRVPSPSSGAVPPIAWRHCNPSP